MSPCRPWPPLRREDEDFGRDTVQAVDALAPGEPGGHCRPCAQQAVCPGATNDGAAPAGPWSKAARPTGPATLGELTGFCGSVASPRRRSCRVSGGAEVGCGL